MKILHFVDAAGTDEHYVPAKNVNLVEMINTSNIKVWFSNSDTNVSDHEIQIGTATGKAYEALMTIGEHMLDDGIAQRAPIAKFQASTHVTNSYGLKASDIASVAYTAGS